VIVTGPIRATGPLLDVVEVFLRALNDEAQLHGAIAKTTKRFRPTVCGCSAGLRTPGGSPASGKTSSPARTSPPPLTAQPPLASPQPATSSQPTDPMRCTTTQNATGCSPSRVWHSSAACARCLSAGPLTVGAPLPSAAEVRAEEYAAYSDDRLGKLFKLLTALAFAAAAVVTQKVTLGAAPPTPLWWPTTLIGLSSAPR